MTTEWSNYELEESPSKDLYIAGEIQEITPQSQFFAVMTRWECVIKQDGWTAITVRSIRNEQECRERVNRILFALNSPTSL